jgi:hypothetical protein
VDESKIRAGLRLALTSPAGGSDQLLAVYVELEAPPSPEQASVLRRVGASGTIEGHEIITARMSRADIRELSDLPWVMAISPCERLRTLSDTSDILATP